MSKSPSESSIYFMIGIFAILGVALVGIGIVPIEVAPDITATVGGTVTPYSTGTELRFKYDELAKCPIGVACVASTHKNFAIVRISVDAAGNVYISSGKVSRNRISIWFKPSSVTLSRGDELKVNLALNMMYVISAPVQIAAPTGVVAKALGDTRVSVTWNSVYGAVSYKVERSGGLSIPTMPYSLVGTSTTTSFNDAVESGTTYKYRVTAVGKDGTNSLPSSEATVTTPYQAPMISSISPSSGSSGTKLSIYGKYFMEGGNVVVCGMEAAVTQFTATVIEAIVPDCKAPGLVDVVVKNSDGQKATLAKGFTYTKPIDEVEHAAMVLAKQIGLDANDEPYMYENFVSSLKGNGLNLIYSDLRTYQLADMFTIVLSPPKDLCKNLPDAIDKCFMNKMAFLFMLFRFANREGSTKIVPWIVDVTSTPIKDDEGKDTGKSKLTLVVNIGVEDGKRTVSAPETAVELESDPFWMTGCQHAIKSALDEIRKNTPNRKDEKGRKVGYNDWTDAEKDAYFNALLALHKAFLKCEFKDGSGDLEHFLEFRITNEKLYTMYRRMGILRSDGFGENNDFEKSLAEIMKEVKARISRLKNQ